MKNKKITSIIILCIICITIINIFVIKHYVSLKNDMVLINEIKKNVEKNGKQYHLNAKINRYDYTIIIENNQEEVIKPIYSTFDFDYKSNTERMNDAYKNGEVIMDFIDGKIIIYTNKYFTNTIYHLYYIDVLIGFALCIIVIIHYIYNDKQYIRPFKTLKNFSISIASGNFNAPLSMDKKNIFGAFTESFDLMRNELNQAKQKAIQLEISKKEFLASLSHDIKTPLSSIKAVNELLMAKETDNNKKVKLNMVGVKANEIEQLINELFTSNIDDIMELKFHLEEIDSFIIKKIICESDHLSKVKFISEVPECLICIDKLKTYQIIDNIIANSYKYASTKIDVSFHMIGDKNQFLQISFKDFGQTLCEDELPLLTSKFYRASNAKEHSGVGLGLYLCDQFLQRMDGLLEFFLDKDCFIVKISFPII